VDPLELAILALRLALVLILYAFLVAVLRVAASSLTSASAESAEHASASRDPRRWTPAARGAEKQSLKLIVLQPGETPFETGWVIEAPSGAILGRGRRATIQLADSTVSTEHAHLGLAGNTWVVRDLGSTNGTLLNESPVDEDAPLSSGDVLRLGNVQLKIATARG
jgi:FHA domain